jgi:hypothetical protein
MKEKLTSTQIHLSIIKMIRDKGLMSIPAIKEFITANYSDIRQTHSIIIKNLKNAGLVDERIGDDKLKYLVFRKPR